MTTRTLLILRHAKSDRDGDAVDDFARPLSARGRRDAPRMGRWLRAHGLRPDFVLSSPALRTRQTTEAVLEALELPQDRLRYDDRLYLAGVDTLLAVIAECPVRTGMLLLVGHNPGLEELLERLSAEAPPRNAAGKLLTAGALARLSMRQTWKNPMPHGAALIDLVRPRELED
ncbi:MAG: histidine phosphatase family protein [Gammaproteobacteria bacterium]|nr:histidine phosphatase family protein [Gammaproteobacteria bacterium]